MNLSILTRNLVLLALLATSSCAIERLFPEEVANGAARLTINNLGNLPRALYDDSIYHLEQTDKRPECDFRTIRHTQTTTVHPNTDGKGKIVREFHNCVFDFGHSGITISTGAPSGCKNDSVTFYGKVTLSGSRTVFGILTGNNEIPIVPSGSEGIVFAFANAVFENYKVESSSLEKSMTIASGSAAFELIVHLAKSETSGLCNIPLPNLTLSNIRYSKEQGASETILTIPGPFGEFQVPVNASNFHAQVGVYSGRTNSLEGTMNLWNQSVRVPSDEPALDPGFARNAYDATLHSCTPDLLVPVSDSCNFEPELASNIARLTINNLGHLLIAINTLSANHKDERCRLDGLHQTPGFWIDNQRRDAQGQGLAVWNFENCEYDVGLLSTKNNGAHFSGKVKISGQRRVFGLLTHDKNNPVIPGESGIEFTFTQVVFTDYSVKSAGLNESLTIRKGQASFEVTVHLEKSGDLQIYQDAYTQPNLTFSKITFLEESLVTVVIPSGDLAGSFSFAINNSNFEAQIGEHKGQKNTLSGNISMFGTKISLPGDGKGLIPGQPSSHFPLNPILDEQPYAKVEDVVADGIARLTVSNLGNLMLAAASTHHPKPECNLTSLARTKKTKIFGAGKYKKVTWQFDNCEFDFGTNGLNIDDSKTFYGKVTLSGQKSIHGFFLGDNQVVVIPGRQGVEFTFDATFENYTMHSKDFNESLRVLEGTTHFDVAVHLAKDRTSELCIEPIQNLTFANIRYGPSRVELHGQFAGGSLKVFQTRIDGSQISAQVGYGETETLDNALSGHISLFGRNITIPTDGLGLDPSPTNIEYFEKSLQNQANLASTQRASLFDCRTFEEVEAATIARLLVLNVGSIAQESFDEWLKPRERTWEELGWDVYNAKAYFTKCGFNSNWAKLKTQIPRTNAISGISGSTGSIELRVENCDVVNLEGRKADYPPDCLGIKTVFEGKARISGIQTIYGKRLPLYETFGYELLSSIVPDSPLAVSLDLREIEPKNFSSYFINDEEPVPKAKLTLTSGVFSAKVHPVLAAKKGLPCEFFRSTPVVGFEIAVRNRLEIQLDFHLKDMHFKRVSTVHSAYLTAQNGIYQGVGNFIDGKIQINNDIPLLLSNEALNPFFEQSNFDKSYDCRQRLPPENDYSIETIINPAAGWTSGCDR